MFGELGGNPSVVTKHYEWVTDTLHQVEAGSNQHWFQQSK